MADAPDTVNSIVLRRGSRHNSRMFKNMRQIFPVVAGAFIAGCAPLSFYNQPGVSVAQMERDTLNCEVAALQQAPVANQIRQAPPRYVPARQYCDANGTCHTRGGYFVSGEVFTVDRNANLRKRLERQCMADKGYAPVKVPQCSVAIKAAAPAGATTILPRLTENTCVIRNDDGSILFVTVPKR